MYIELVDKIIKIPPTKKYLVVGEDNPQEFIFKIPKKLITSDEKQSKVFLLWKLCGTGKGSNQRHFVLQ